MHPNPIYRSNSFAYYFKPKYYIKSDEIKEVLIPNNVIHVDFVSKKKR